MSSAELVYGAPMTLPGEFLHVTEDAPSSYMEHLRATPSSIPMKLTYSKVTSLPPKPLREAIFLYVK